MQMRYLPHRMSARFFDGMRSYGVESERLFTVARNLPPVSMFGMRDSYADLPSGASRPAAEASRRVQEVDEAMMAKVVVRSS